MFIYVGTSNESLLLNDTGRRISASEVVPITALGISSIIGCFLNLIAGFAYSRKEKAFQNPGNLFTMSLIVGDLLFSGIVFPLIIALETLDPSSPTIWKRRFYTGARCFILFCCILNAVGNSLLAFDRFDLTQRPSNRFLRQKQTLLFISIGWIIAALSMLSPLLSAVLPLKNSFNKTFYFQQQNFLLRTTDLSHKFAENSSRKIETTCNASCFTAQTSFVYPASTAQVSIQLIFYVFATLILLLIYGQIHYSLNKRASRHETPDHSPSVPAPEFNFKSFLKQIFGCIQTTEPSLNIQNMELCSNEEVLASNEAPTRIDDRMQIKSTTQTLAVPQETRPFSMNRSGERLQLSQVETRVYDSTASSTNTDFATVAFSVKAFMTLKKAVRERRKRKERKLRQFRRMSIAIVVAYGMSWLPFQIYCLATLIVVIPQDLRTICNLRTCSDLSFSAIDEEIILTNSRSNLNKTACEAAFLWCLVFASLSPIADAILYSFSRENIRKEVKKSYRQATKSNDISDLPVKRNRSKSLLLKTTEFMSLDGFKSAKQKKRSEKRHYPNRASSWEGNPKGTNGRQIPRIVPLKDPDAIATSSKNQISTRKLSITSILSSNKSTFETSFVSSKSATNSLNEC